MSALRAPIAFLFDVDNTLPVAPPAIGRIVRAHLGELARRAEQDAASAAEDIDQRHLGEV